MNFKLDPFSPLLIAEQQRRFWVSVFAGGIRMARQATGHSIEETAELAGMKYSEWAAIEAGSTLPQSDATLQAMAGALEIDYIRLAKFVLHCRLGWEN